MKEYVSKNIIFPVYVISILALSSFVKQSDFVSMGSFYLIAFVSYFLIGIISPLSEKWINRSFWIKLFLVFVFPLASDDVFRFYWDGMVSTQGISPYAFLPLEIRNINEVFSDQEVFQKLNSKSYYSVYPPALQVLFGLCFFLSFKSVYIFTVLWKFILLFADFGSMYFLKKYNASSRLMYWFAFNPLIMYEVFANGHPEGLLLFFLIGMMWAIKQNKVSLGFVFLSCAAAIKIFPLVFFPLLTKNVEYKRVLKLSFFVVLLLSIFFLPIYPYFDHFMESIRLYFKKFEFNGSFFELWKWIDYRRFGFDNIAGISRFLSMGFLLVLLVLTIKHLRSKGSELANTMFWIWLSYLLLASTVHPWYVLPVFLFSLFLSDLSGMVWSLLVIFSYTWYDPRMQECKYGFLIVEYGLFFLTMILERMGNLDRLKDKIFKYVS